MKDVGKAMQAYYQRKLSPQAKQPGALAENIDIHTQNHPSLLPQVQANSLAESDIHVQQSSILDTVQMKSAKSGNEDNLQQRSDSETAQHPGEPIVEQATKQNESKLYAIDFKLRPPEGDPNRKCFDLLEEIERIAKELKKDMMI